MNVAGSRAPTGRPKILTREDFEKNKQAQSTQNSTTPSPPAGRNGATKKSKPRNRRRKPSSKRGNEVGYKVVVRMLPPNLKAEDFWSKVEDFITTENVFEKYYVQGKYSNKPFKLPIYSRAYIQFKDSQVVDQFVAKYKEVTFEDDKESMIPTFAMALFTKMPEDDKPVSKPKQSLQDLAIYQTFLKFYNGETDRPQTFLVSGKKAEAKSEKKVEKPSEKGQKKQDQPSKKDEKKKKEKKEKRDKKRAEAKANKANEDKKDTKDKPKDKKPKDIKSTKDPKDSKDPKDAKDTKDTKAPGAANSKKKEGVEQKKKQRNGNNKKREGKAPENKANNQQKVEAKPKSTNNDKPKQNAKTLEKEQQNNGENAKKNEKTNGANARPKIQLLKKSDSNSQAVPKKPVLLKKD